jgi:tetratricopeptide (TPR) repeat protein
VNNPGESCRAPGGSHPNSSVTDFRRAQTKTVLLVSVVLFVLALFSGRDLFAQGFSERIYASYVKGEMDDWRRAITEMEALWNITGSEDLLYDLIVAEYGYIAYAIGVDRKKEARAMVKKTGERLELLLEASPDMARAHALLGAVYGFKVGLNPYKAPVLGLKSFEANARAFELDPEDPQVWVEKGHIEFFKPTIFGSNSAEAAEIYQHAVELFERNPEALEHNWLYLNALRSLADAYIASEQYRKADASFKKILRIEPQMKWIREKEYPRFLKKYGDRL